MRQHKATYTRRFNKLKADLAKALGEDVVIDDTASLRWGPEACIVAHDGSLGFTVWFLDDETGEYSHCVSIVKTPSCYKGGLVGIHVRETDLGHILDCIETALKDGFENIYVESIGAQKAG